MTLQKPDGTKTENTEETLKLLLDQLTPEDNPQDDTHYHKCIRKQTEQPLHTMNDKEFTQEDDRQVIEGLKQKKAQGTNG
jgi:hypothetical protein